MKRIVSAILVLVLTLSICGVTTSCSGRAKGKSEIVEGSKYGKYVDTVTFTTVRPGFPVNWPEGMDITHNPYWDVIREELNVECEVLWDSSSYNDKLLLDITTGNIPDIFAVDDYNTYRQLYLSDMLEDLTDVYEEYASDDMKKKYNVYSAANSPFNAVTENGRLMALPANNDGYQEPLLWIRKDWLDLLGLEVPRTVEDIAKVAEAFVTQDPGGNGKGNTVGIAFNGFSALATDGTLSLLPVANALGAFPQKWLTDENGQVYYGSTSPAMKQTLQTVLDWYDRGILDKDCFTNPWETTLASINEGRAGMWFATWSFALDGEFIKNNPRAEIIPVAAPLDNEGKFTYVDVAPSNWWLCVRKGYEHPEVIFKLYEIYLDVRNGKDYPEKYVKLQELWDSGVPWNVLSPLAGFEVRDYDGIPRGAAKVQTYLDTGVLPDDVDPNSASFPNSAYARSKAWIESGVNGGDLWYMNWAYYMARCVGSAAQGSEVCNPIQAAYYYKTNGMLEDWSVLSTEESNMIACILTGIDDISYFDVWVQDWKEAGGEAITAEVQAIVDENK